MQNNFKDIVIKYVPWVLICVMFVLLIPGLNTRVINEGRNKNVVVSVLYNDVANKLSSGDLDKFLDDCLAAGADTVSIMEDDLNILTTKGELTSIKYNVLCHKYDDESIRVAEAIAQNFPDVTYDSHIILAKKQKAKDKLAHNFPLKYDETIYGCIKDVEGMDIYVLYDGRKEQWDYSFGYDEEVIDKLYRKGFKIALVHKVKNYPRTEYLQDIDRIVKKYDVKYMNLKEDTSSMFSETVNKDNYLGLSDIINKNSMTLVVTENTDQLSNQKFLGYSEVFARTVSDNGTKKVIRSYETYDDSQANGVDYKYRVSQLFNSTVDRNIRFINITQISLQAVSYKKCSELTVMAMKEYLSKISSLGFKINGNVNPLNYTLSKQLPYTACAVIMIMCVLIMLQWVFNIEKLYLTILAFAASMAAFAAGFAIPDSLLSLYPTLYSVVQSCFVMTAVLAFVKHFKDKLSFISLALTTVLIAVSSLGIMSVGMSVMLSGIDYYINNDIFRGIKLSLLVPLVYTTVVYYFMFVKTKDTGIIKTTKKVLCSDIKVYWMLIAAVIGGIGAYYIIRSGNVNRISGIEQAFRTWITEIFPARPRTKEFLIGYPALVLFIYYIKHYDLKLVNWVLAVGASILSASVTNSFCHVFTDYGTILMRVVNGLVIGVAVSVVVYLVNLILVKTAKKLK